MTQIKRGDPWAAYAGDLARHKADAMNDRPVWEKIATAPYDRDLELAVIEGGRVHPLIFACRRTPGGWIKMPTCERVTVSPTHWRPWPTRDLFHDQFHGQCDG